MIVLMAAAIVPWCTYISFRFQILVSRSSLSVNGTFSVLLLTVFHATQSSDLQDNTFSLS